ncbi:unnamed protein product [Caenorhabditis sp. 36 PRJEB53466]|nr:unnamed protein product [Caenorhabditis sp. 36 PRJEB53466]
MSLRLYKFPDLLIRKVLCQMNATTLFELSLCSTESKIIVKKLKLKPSKLEIDFGEGHIDLNFGKQLESIYWEVKRRTTPPSGRYLTDRVICGKIIGIETRANLLEKPNSYLSYTISVEWLLYFLTEYMLDIFDAKVTRIVSHWADLHWPILFLWKSFQNCPSVTLHAHNIGQMNMQLLMDNVNATERFEIKLKNKVEFTRKKLFNCEYFSCLGSAELMSRKKLVSFDSRVVRLGMTSYTTRDLNYFIKKWLRSRNLKLEMLVLQLNRGYHFEEDDIFNQIYVEWWDETKRAPYYCDATGDFIEFIDASNGYEIERFDGMLATVLLDQDKFHFLVWHNRFPPQPEDDF